MDFAATSKGRAAVKCFLDDQGYVPEKLFNAIHGAQRLNYAEPNGRWTMDILIDELAMSHRLDLRGRLDGPQPTISLADLVLTKLQIWEINRKDVGDVLCLLADHPLGKDGVGAIGLDESEPCSARIGASVTRPSGTWARLPSCGPRNPRMVLLSTSRARSRGSSPPSPPLPSRWRGRLALGSGSGFAGTRRLKRSSTRLRARPAPSRAPRRGPSREGGQHLATEDLDGTR